MIVWSAWVRFGLNMQCGSLHLSPQAHVKPCGFYLGSVHSTSPGSSSEHRLPLCLVVCLGLLILAVPKQVQHSLILSLRWVLRSWREKREPDFAVLRFAVLLRIGAPQGANSAYCCLDDYRQNPASEPQFLCGYWR